MFDTIFPKNNEKEFLEIAKKLRTKELYLIYPFQKNIKPLETKIRELQSITKIKLNLGLIANQKDIPKAKNKCKFILTESTEKDQYTLEKLKPNLLFNLEKDERKDKTHYRLSGLNQVLCKLANKNKITIAFSFEQILKEKNKPQLLGRIIQNLRFCKKYKVNTIIRSFASNPYNLKSIKQLESLKRILNSKF